MAQNAKAQKGQGHASRSSVRSLKFRTALHMLIINMLKKFDNDAIARFC